MTYGFKPCACTKMHANRYTKGRCTAEVVRSHRTGWCFLCADHCAGWLRRLWWRVTLRGRA